MNEVDIDKRGTGGNAAPARGPRPRRPSHARRDGVHRLAALSLLAAIVAGFIGHSLPASAAAFRGVEFPQGAASFADAVVSYNPLPVGHVFRADVTNPAEALGPPDDVTGIPAEYVSLGNGGSLTLRFINNALTGSASTAKDLWVFEIGEALEDTDVAISRDGISWIEVGGVTGSISGIDIDPFISDPATSYSYVRLTDVAADNFSTGNTAGADIDAVGAISTIVRPADATPPVLTLPGDITAEATGPDGAIVTFTVTANDLVDGALTPACVPASGALFPLGPTAVSCSATDDAGNTGTAGFTVSVVDTTVPALTLPADITAEATSAKGAAVNFDAATASDLVDGAVTPACDAASGHTFPLGTTTVTCSASDVAGNTATAGFTVSVVDTTAPALTVPADLTIEATGPDGALVEFTASASDLVDGAVTPACDAVSGEAFPLGATTVTCSASDIAGNTATDAFTISVVDTTAPALTLPADVTVVTVGTGAAVEFAAATASDLVDGAVTPVCDAASGDTFPLGATTVTCTAADVAGNTGSGSFVVTVAEQVYVVCPLFDQSKAVKAGAVKPIKLQLCDAAGANLSEPGLVLHATGLVKRDGTPSAQVEDAGNANPDFDFRYDDDLAGYIFNLDTDGLSAGTWELRFTVSGGSHLYKVAFDVK
jgi:hypothetical protein